MSPRPLLCSDPIEESATSRGGGEGRRASRKLAMMALASEKPSVTNPSPARTASRNPHFPRFDDEVLQVAHHGPHFVCQGGEKRRHLRRDRAEPGERVSREPHWRGSVKTLHKLLYCCCRSRRSWVMIAGTAPTDDAPADGLHCKGCMDARCPHCRHEHTQPRQRPGVRCDRNPFQTLSFIHSSLSC
jgi:hypothetical protein